MIKQHILTVLWLLLLLNLNASAQEKILPFGEVIQLVKAHHPLANIARLGPEMAKAQLMKARGGFDPVATGSLSQKYYDSKQYYSLGTGQLKVPTPIGVDLMAGLESNTGIFLNQEDSTPPGGLLFGGISLPVGQGLIIDERRADLWTAGITAENAALNQQNLTNNLLFDASEIYWDWFRSYHIMKIADEAYNTSLERMEAIRRYARAGDRPAIDTTEALIQVQNLGILLNQATLDYTRISRFFSGFFWNSSGSNTGLDQGASPVKTQEVFVQIQNEEVTVPFGPDFFDNDNHPYLRQLVNKIRQLNIDRRLKKDKLKPRADLKYIPLAQNIGSNPLSQFNLSNYRWGIEFKMPLFLRKERGDLRMAELKVREADLFLQHKSTELYNKWNNKITEWENTTDQISLSSQTVDLYRTMLDAERKLFEIGESSVFLINAREQALINAQIKLTETIAKNRSAYYAIFYLAGKMATLEAE